MVPMERVRHGVLPAATLDLAGEWADGVLLPSAALPVLRAREAVVSKNVHTRRLDLGGGLGA